MAMAANTVAVSAAISPRMSFMGFLDRIVGWWGYLESNQGPHRYQRCALTD
jgi:hypothetical protein